MQKNKLVVPVLLVVIAMVASACSSTLAALPATTANDVQGNLVEVSQVEARPAEASPAGSPVEPGLLAAYEDTLTSIYEQVNPSVVNIRVVGAESAVVSLPEGMPSIPGLPEVPQSQEPYSQSLGSGFVWDKQGYIITNNHVVEGAQKIEVTFSNDTVVNAELVGNDPDSDLAVIKVDLSPDELQPIQIADSDLVRVGQLAIAIGNPFGLEGTMTVGIVSALGRSLPASEDLTGGPVYSIPDVIQTDAPINPGNSGGVLINASGEVIGVTSAIESPVRANAGIGFVIPASIVERVVPQLIENGTFAHPYLGITGISLYPDLAESMDLDKDQKGALVAGVVQDGPADKAGLRGSDRQETIDGIDMAVGGDVILAIDGNPVNDMDDLIAYLSENTAVDQEVTLRVLRDGKEVEINVTLEARPTGNVEVATSPLPVQGRAWLGILGMPLSPEIAGLMNLPEDQTGVLVLEVQADSPALEAGLIGSDEAVTVNGESINIGGDVVTKADGNAVTDVQQLAAYLQEVGPGNAVTLTILRDGKTISVDVVLGQQP